MIKNIITSNITPSTSSEISNTTETNFVSEPFLLSASRVRRRAVDVVCETCTRLLSDLHSSAELDSNSALFLER